jgi:hypothetical protein
LTHIFSKEITDFRRRLCIRRRLALSARPTWPQADGASADGTKTMARIAVHSRTDAIIRGFRMWSDPVTVTSTHNRVGFDGRLRGVSVTSSQIAPLAIR